MDAGVLEIVLDHKRKVCLVYYMRRICVCVLARCSAAWVA